MASFIRAKQAGVQTDLSQNIQPMHFMPDEQARYGINSQISCLAYDPVQSLLAVGTNESKFGPGKIYVFGQRRVHKFFCPPRPSSIRELRFVANRLISLDSKNELAIWDLDTGNQVAKYVYSGVVCLVTDPMLDWAFVGLQSGDIAAYDLDRERPSTFRIPNFWRERDPNPTAGRLVSMQLHPRDIGKILIAYTNGAVIYSFKQNIVQKYFEYELPPDAPGGDGHGIHMARKPNITHAVWHPTGTFILTAHQDGSLAIWDTKEGRLVTARSLYRTRVNEPTSNPPRPMRLAPFVRISWCCQTDPDNTGLLIAGGHNIDDPTASNLTFLELGPTPIYATSSWEVLAAHFDGKRSLPISTPPGASVVNYLLIPRSSPYFNGAQDPIAVLVQLSSGELITLTFPSGFPISPTNMLHPSLSFVHPFVQTVAVSTVPRARWLGMAEKRSLGEQILRGGVEYSHRTRKEQRNIVQVLHADNIIRLWDVGRGDEIENAMQCQVDVARSLNRFEGGVETTAMHMAQETGEFAAGTKTGEVIVWRWGFNKNFGKEEPRAEECERGGLMDISSRAEPSLKEGLQPFVMHNMAQGRVTVVAVSDVGFVAAGSEGGHLSIIDLRGPKVIYHGSVTEWSKGEKRGLFKHSSSSSHGGKPEWPTVIEFGVMTLEGENYSSICCFVGTNTGRVATFKLLPSGQGYSVQLAGVANMDDKVVAICPIEVQTGREAGATGPIVAGLREGKQVDGVLVAVTQTESKIFRPPHARGASKSFDSGILCDAAAVTPADTSMSSHGYALVAVFNDRTLRSYTLPGLREIAKHPLPMLDPLRTISTVISKTGDVLGFTGPSEITVLPVWGGSGRALENTLDTMINIAQELPPRPTISNVQWLSGTQYISPTDLDLLIGGPDRPPSKRMMAATDAERNGAGVYNPAAAGAAGSSTARLQGQVKETEGWGDYLTRQLNERTEKLNIMGDSMDNLANTTSKWAEDVDGFVKKQKRDLFLGGIKKSFF
ncbi:lethal giant larvae like, C-terminal-domain-containing protein [Neurospora hispaniola]|uniref:Lethal giant larvae like, C-terminal-domain-containing protein n=1 Tax=Neurospora hispaniola TaxID=588809 RepID=A0AAJ0HYR9_9PEZI|nr:lethal giant larvae like, C-terminal-domain-containing protein [Neurospora hispaniola]